MLPIKLSSVKNSQHINNVICGIYKITSPSGKIYIGQSKNILKRLYRYRLLFCKFQLYLYNSLRKYGADAHTYSILCECRIPELNEMEEYYVEMYEANNKERGLNLKKGGGSKANHSEESKRRMSIAQKGRKLFGKALENVRKGAVNRIGTFHTEETKMKMKISRQKQLSRSGWHHSEETKIKISQSNMGHSTSEETRKKMSEKLKGRIMSDEYKKNMSNRLKGRIFSEEHKQKLKDAWIRIKQKRQEEPCCP